MTMTTEKTYQFGSAGDPLDNINQPQGAWGNPRTSQEVHLKIKASLLRVPLFPWSVVKSCDASSVSDLDLWDSYSKLTGGTGNHSWIVYEQPAIAPNFQMCFDLNHTYEAYCTVVTSAGGFDDNGAINSRPTASDEVVHQSASLFMVPTYSFNEPIIINVVVSNDGECTRIWTNWEGKAPGILIIDKPKSPEVGWVDPYVVICYSNGTIAPTYEELNDQARTRSRFNGVNVAYYLGTIFFGAHCMGEQIGGMNDQLGEWETYPVWLCSGNDADRRGTKGMLYDFWFATENPAVLEGDVYPPGGPYTHTIVGEIVLPWTNVARLTS